jgi:hypothetical protein
MTVKTAVVVPTWIIPTFLGVVILVTGVVVRSMAAEEAERLDTKHLAVVKPDIVALEADVLIAKLNMAKYDSDIANIQKAVDRVGNIAAENQSLIIRIAAKLDVQPTQ